jgi:hypothetical protein
LLKHTQDGIAIRLFSGASGIVTYVGQYEVDHTKPHYAEDAPDVDREMRKTIIFRLNPVGHVDQCLFPIVMEELRSDESPPECQIIDAEGVVTFGEQQTSSDFRGPPVCSE